jgi:hypothetical protein
MDDQTAQPTRRALLGAAIGAAAAVAVDALGRPPAVLAGVDGDVVLGTENRSTNQTSILNDSAASGATAFKGWTYGTGVGVDGTSLLGTGIRGETADVNGIAGSFVAPTGGTALQVDGKARFGRSGVATLAKGRSYVAVTVAGGLTNSSIVLAVIQVDRPGVAVSGVRRNYPSAGKARIYLTKVASTTTTTPIGWFVIA